MKKPTGYDVTQNEIAPVTALSPKQVRRAQLYVCGKATDAADARRLMEILGLVSGPRKARNHWGTREVGS